MWKPEIRDAENISASAYKIIYEQGLQRFEECASESESITNKSIKLLLGILSLGVFFSGFCIQNSIKPGFIYLLLFGFVYIWDIYLLFKLMSPRRVYHRGIRPKDLFPQNLDKEINQQQESIVYYHAICMTEQRVNDYYILLSSRTNKYKKAILISMFLLFATIAIVAITIYRPLC